MSATAWVLLALLLATVQRPTARCAFDTAASGGSPTWRRTTTTMVVLCGMPPVPRRISRTGLVHSQDRLSTSTAHQVWRCGDVLTRRRPVVPVLLNSLRSRDDNDCRT